MNYSIILKIIGWVIQLEGVFFLPPALTGLIYREYKDALIYLILGILCITVGGLIRLHKPAKTTFFAKEGFVAVSGWQETTSVNSGEFCKKLRDTGISTVIYTDISKDGMLSGTNLEIYKELSKFNNKKI